MGKPRSDSVRQKMLSCKHVPAALSGASACGGKGQKNRKQTMLGLNYLGAPKVWIMAVKIFLSYQNILAPIAIANTLSTAGIALVLNTLNNVSQQDSSKKYSVVGSIVLVTHFCMTPADPSNHRYDGVCPEFILGPFGPRRIVCWRNERHQG